MFGVGASRIRLRTDEAILVQVSQRPLGNSPGGRRGPNTGVPWPCHSVGCRIGHSVSPLDEIERVDKIDPILIDLSILERSLRNGVRPRTMKPRVAVLRDCGDRLDAAERLLDRVA